MSISSGTTITDPKINSSLSNEQFKLPLKSFNRGNPDDDIVITGISGRYPASNNVDHFWQNLMSGQELSSVDDRRWPVEYLNTPPRQGKIETIEKMDYEFFGVKPEDANCMDPQIRTLHETAYEAIVDAGINPVDMRGTRTAVFIGHCYDDTDSAIREDPSKVPGYRQLSAARLSYAFDFRGPVFCTDTACASSFSAFFKAVCAIRAGDIESAVVCGATIHLSPYTAVAFHNLKMLSDDGRCKCLDADADGYCRSEAIVSVLLQKRSAAKRIYANILNVRTNNDGFKPEGITFPSYFCQRKLMVETYSEIGMDPKNVEYMEAHMTGTTAGDPVESAAITDVCCPEDRTIGPLLMGCLKSNMGHTEGASGTCAITKACLVFQRKEIPPNLFLKTPNPRIEGLTKGLLKPVTERMPFHGSIIGVNSFGFGGCNVHAILEANERTETAEDHDITSPGIPRLVPFCGRTKEGVEKAFAFLQENPDKVTRGFLALMESHARSTPKSGMNIRGYALLDNGKIVSQSVDRTKEEKPLWLVFSALGCQWPAMAQALMSLPPFSQSIGRSVDIVKRHNLGPDLETLLLDPSQKLESLVESFLAIVSVQIALVDCLYFLNLKVDGIIGHSIGEICAAYADGAMTQEQTVLTAFHISDIVSRESTLRGGMAAVGLSWSAMQERLDALGTKNLYIGCNNANDTITLSGEESELKKVLSDLRSEGIFAKEVDSCGIAFHSPLVQSAHAKVVHKLQSVLTHPKARSSAWLSTSIEQERWHEQEAKVVGPSYYPNCMVNPVHFADVLQFVPKNAIAVEVGPHAMLLSLLKRGLGPDATVVPLMKRDNSEGNMNLLMSGFGAIYVSGSWPLVSKLYPTPEFPVPRETASLSPLIHWDHSKDLNVTKFPDYFNVMKGDQMVTFDLMEQKSQFLAGHCIDGRVLFPATGYLWIIWQRLSFSLGVTYEDCPVEFSNVRFLRATMLPKAGNTAFKIVLMPESGQFSITEGGSVCVTGFIRRAEEASTLDLEEQMDFPETAETVVLQTKEIYKEFRVRGYDYGPTFQGLVEAKADGSQGQIKWLGNWINLTDSMLQTAILGKKERGLFLPTFMDYMKCDVKRLLEAIKSNKNEMGESLMNVKFDHDINGGFTNGLVLKGLKTTPAPRRSHQTATVESYAFVPYDEEHLLLPARHEAKRASYADYCTRMLQIVATDNSNGLREAIEADENLKIILESSDDKHILSKTLWQVIRANDKAEKKDGEEKVEVKADVCLKKLLKDSLDKVADELSSDLLLTSSLVTENMLRVMIDVVAENFNSKKVDITEANQSGHLMHDVVSEAIDNLGLVFNSYRLLHPQPERMAKVSGLDASILESHTKVNECDLIIMKDESLCFAAASTEPDGKASDFSLTLFLKSVATTMKEHSFCLILFRSEVTAIEDLAARIIGRPIDSSKLKDLKSMEALSHDSGLEIISRKSGADGTHSLLLRKVPELAEETRILIDVRVNEYSWIDQMKDHLLDKDGQEKKKYKIWLIARDSPSNGIVGLMNCIKRELTTERVRCIFAPDFGCEKSVAEDLLNPEILRKDLVMNVVRNGAYGSFRHFTIEDIETFEETEHAFLDVKTKGDLSSLRWVQGDHKYWTELPAEKRNPKDLLISVNYAALNFKDIMVATGRIPVDAYPADFMGRGLIGMEFSGKDATGRRVLAFCPSKGIATTLLLPDGHFVWQVPDHWTMAEAATVPVVYTTVYYALFVRGNLRDGESVLIHAGSGGIGQAAISVCLAHGCQVFATVGTTAKKEFLLKTFPQLKESHIGNSRDCSFEEMVMKETNGRGVDIVLNSLADEKLQASIRCLADFGRFLELGKYDVIHNSKMNLSDMGRNKTFHVVCVAHLDYDAVVNKSESAIKLCHRLHDYMDSGIKSGAIRPLKYHIFENTESEEAFRFMATGKHTGKVLIKMREDEEIGNLPQAVTKTALRQTVFHPLKSYIITGGLGGFGLEVADWLVQRGVKTLILTSRSGIKNSFQEVTVRRLRKQGTHVLISMNDISTREGTEALIDEASAIAPIGGILHLAMVLRDATLENQTPESFAETCACKVAGTMHLDSVTRTKAASMDHFVVFSSVTSGRGNVGQLNYGFANSCMERTCEARRKDGLPGLAIQWGAVGDVGVVAESLGGNDVVIGGTLPQRMPSCFAVLDSLLQSRDWTTASSIVKADKKRGVIGGKGDLLRQVCHILGVKDPHSLDPNTTLGDLGLDSLMAVEIRQALERDYDMVLSAQEVRSLSIKDIQNIGAKAAAGGAGAGGPAGSGKGDGKGKSGDGKAGVLPILLSEPVQMFQPMIGSHATIGGRPIFVIPSLTGDLSLFQRLITSVTRPTIGINWTKELDPLSSVKEVAQFIVTALKQFYPDSVYDITALGFGCLIAHEVALLILKQVGSKSIGKLLFIDGSERYCRSIDSVAKSFIGIADETEGHIQSILSFVRFHYHSVQDLTDLEQDLRAGKNKEQRLKSLSKFMADNSGNNNSTSGEESADGPAVDLLDPVIGRFCHKIQLVEEYKSSGKFVGPLRLFRPSTAGYTGLPIDGLPADYGLSEQVDGVVDTLVLEGDSDSFLVDHVENVSNMIDLNFQYLTFA